MDVDNGACSSSDEEGNAPELNSFPHSADIRVDLGSERAAEIIMRTLAVDKEPSRSNAVRKLSVEGSHLVMHVSSNDRRSLQKSLANLFDMCELAKSTIDLVDKKSWIVTKPNDIEAKRPKLEENGSA